MATYLISYDLNAPGRDYAAVTEYLKSMPKWWHRLDSTWLVVTDLSATALRDRLKSITDQSDEILVIRVDGSSWAGSGFSSYTWIRDNL